MGKSHASQYANFGSLLDATYQESPLRTFRSNKSKIKLDFYNMDSDDYR